MIDNGAMACIIKMIEPADVGLKVILLRSLRKIFEHGKIFDNDNKFMTLFESLDGLKIVESLQYNNNDIIYETALKFIRDFYETNEILDNNYPPPQ